MKINHCFFDRNSVEVARELLGSYLISKKEGNEVVGKIVETEAYWGEDDLACHASKGKTKRTEVLFGEPAHLYVYLNYGIFYLTNVVCGPDGFPGAVLIRSAEIQKGQNEAKKRLSRSKFVKVNDFLATGPGKLSIAFGITKDDNMSDIAKSSQIYFLKSKAINEKNVKCSERIGVDYAKHCKNYKWRFYLSDNKYVSKIK